MDYINSDILKLITCLLAVIAIIAIFLHHKPTGQSIRKVHIWYICGIATFIVIQLVTWICIGNPESTMIMQTISFAATLASLILSVLAIFITVISNDSLVRVKDSLNDVPKEVSDSVDKSLSKLTSLSNTLESSATKNKEDQEATVKQISELLEQLEKHIEKRFKDHDMKFDDLSKRVDQSVMTSKSMQDGIKKTTPKDGLIEYFVANTSILALQMIYVSNAFIDYKASRPMSVNDFLNVLGYKDDKELVMYMFCVVMMLSSFGLLEYNQATEGDFNNLIINSIYKPLVNKSYERIKSTLSEENLEKKINDYVMTLVSSEEDELPKDN
ncbi:MAG: hypothetical protein KBT06_08685 [Prevotellaceae bacterium]|nr:hypothetical protein [Candidatus Colivivens equi]